MESLSASNYNVNNIGSSKHTYPSLQLKAYDFWLSSTLRQIHTSSNNFCEFSPGPNKLLDQSDKPFNAF